MTTQADSTLRQHMFALAPLRVWWRLLREHGGVAPRRRGALHDPAQDLLVPHMDAVEDADRHGRGGRSCGRRV